MKPDLYTKTILTVIAIALSIIAIGNLFTPQAAHADQSIGKPFIVPVNEDGTVSVKITNTDALDVNIDGVGGGYVPYGRIKVEMYD